MFIFSLSGCGSKDDFDYYVSMMLYKMRGCVAALVKDNGLYTGGNGDFGYFSYN